MSLSKPVTNIKWIPILEDYNLPDHEVSNKGHCRNKKTGYIFKGKPKGYVSWGFTQRDEDKNVIRRHFQAHIIIADSFGLIKLPGQIEIDHINRIRHDNRIENLRWATKAQQQEYFVGARLFLEHVTTSWSNELQSLASSPGYPAGSLTSTATQPPHDAPRSRGRYTCDRRLPCPSLRSRCRAS